MPDVPRGKESRVGKQLSDKTTQRVISIVLVAGLALGSVWAGYYLGDLQSWQKMLDILKNA